MFYDQSVEVAAKEVAKDDGEVEGEDGGPVGGEGGDGDAEVVEDVGYAVREAAHDEQRYAEEQWEKLLLAGKGDGSGHDESAADGKDAAVEDASAHPGGEDAGGCLLQGQGRAAGKQGYEQTADDITKKDEEQRPHLTAFDEACRTCVQLQFVMNDSKQSEGKQDCANDGFLGQVAETCYADTDAGKHRTLEVFYHNSSIFVGIKVRQILRFSAVDSDGDFFVVTVSADFCLAVFDGFCANDS